MAVIESNIGYELSALARRHVELGFELGHCMEQWEKMLVLAALDNAGGNQCQAARMLGVHRNTINRKMIEAGISVENVRGTRRSWYRKVIMIHAKPGLGNRP